MSLVTAKKIFFKRLRIEKEKGFANMQNLKLLND
jgi:hypothetical protein